MSGEPLRFHQWRPHPWHGISVGAQAPEIVNTYIEITPFDFVKYETDKRSGYLKVDRPQMTSALPPSLYGFIPRTWCGPRVAALSSQAEEGDGDPLDVCVLTDRPINRADVIVEARAVGVLRAIDGGMSDDKILAVACCDPLMEEVRDLEDLSRVTLNRLHHYFTTYKQEVKGENPVQVYSVEGRDKALEIIRASMEDYATLNSQAIESSAPLEDQP